MRKPELEYITPRTQYTIGFLASLGHKCSLYRKGEDWYNDVFIVDDTQVKRKNFYNYASKRHRLLRYSDDMFYNIKYYLEDWVTGRIFA